MCNARSKVKIVIDGPSNPGTFEVGVGLSTCKNPWGESSRGHFEYSLRAENARLRLVVLTLEHMFLSFP
jgi:hypothetical protein